VESLQLRKEVRARRVGARLLLVLDLFFSYLPTSERPQRKAAPTSAIPAFSSPESKDLLISVNNTLEGRLQLLICARRKGPMTRDTLTGGRVERLEASLRGQTFMVTYGEGVSNIDINAHLRFHKSCGRLATLTAVRPPARFRGANLTKQKVKCLGDALKQCLRHSAVALASSQEVS